MTNNLVCECCNIHQAIGVASIPYLPVSVAFCIPCLKADNYPYWSIVANTACIGGRQQSSTVWQQMIQSTCQYQDVSMEQFDKDVQQAIAQMEQYDGTD